MACFPFHGLTFHSVALYLISLLPHCLITIGTSFVFLHYSLFLFLSRFFFINQLHYHCRATLAPQPNLNPKAKANRAVQRGNTDTNAPQGRPENNEKSCTSHSQRPSSKTNQPTTIPQPGPSRPGLSANQLLRSLPCSHSIHQRASRPRRGHHHRFLSPI